jgi:hypothetical protein
LQFLALPAAVRSACSALPAPAQRMLLYLPTALMGHAGALPPLQVRLQ